MKAVLLFLILSSSLILSQTTIYVNSTTGHDITGDGTAGNPFKTFYMGYTSLPAEGGTLDLTGTFTWTNADETGDIPFSGYVINKNITIQGHGPGTSIIQSDVTANTADRRIFSINPSVSINIKNLEIRYGKVNDDGGAIYSNGGSIIISDSYIHHNISPYSAGAVYITLAPLNISNSTFFQNQSQDYAGALYLLNVTAQITNCTFTGNYSGFGGAIYIYDSPVTLTNSTIAYNLANYFGGGISQTTSTEPVIIKNTIIGHNVSNNTAIEDYDFSRGVLADNGSNIVEFSNGAWGFGTIRGNQTDLNLSPTLETNNAANGVPTLKLTAGSIAIDAGSNTANGSVSIPATDQRGAARNGAVDIGAYECWSDDGALPVELTSFTASTAGRKVTLNWQTASEVNNYGFAIERSNDGRSIWQEIGFVVGNGNSNSEKKYEFTDVPDEGNSFRYRLKQTDNDGQYKYFGIEEVNLMPEEFSVKQNYPNPFNPATTIEFSIPYDTQVEVKLYNSIGTELGTIYNEFTEAGAHKLTFNAGELASGVYFYKVKQGTRTEVRKMLLLK